MQLKLFIVPVKHIAAAEAEMNGFLRTQRVLAVKKEYVADGGVETSGRAFTTTTVPASTGQRGIRLQGPQGPDRP